MCLGIPSKIITLDAVDKTGRVDHLGAKVAVNLALLDDVRVGDWVIVHAGFAISKLDKKEAREPSISSARRESCQHISCQR